jgi:hypothetical protein
LRFTREPYTLVANKIVLQKQGPKSSHPKTASASEENKMTTVHTEVSAVIDAPPAEVYAIFADYRTAHPQIVPKPTFGDIIVEKGGQGAGTVYRTSVTVMGQRIDYYMTVSEPEPGRKLVEVDEKQGLTTSFIVDPLEGGKKCRVTLATDWTPKPGIIGWIEKFSTPGIMRKLYTTELENVQAYVKKQPKPGSGGFR